MDRQSNKVADGLLASAHDSAVHDGLRLALPRYLEAVDALVQEDRKSEGTAVLAELLSAREKRRGLFLTKREVSPLGNERHAVAKKYAALAFGEAPTEASLDVLNQIALEYSDDADIRFANAEALRLAGYLLDALDEFKYCADRLPADAGVTLKIADVYTQLGRPEEAAQQLANSAEPQPEHAEPQGAGAASFSSPSHAPEHSSPEHAALENAGPEATGAASFSSPPPSPEPATASEASAPPRRKAAGGLSAFAKRRALELFANSEYEAASRELERVVRLSPDVEALEMLLECYLVLERHGEAARVGVQLADAELAAGNRPGAIARLTTLSKKLVDPTVEQRRVELMQNR